MTSTTNNLHNEKRVIVVGAGWAGLVAAKTYLQVDPSIHLTIIDADRTLGGVWSADRVYPGLIADSPVGLFDYSDLDMPSVTGLKDWADIPAQKVYDYLYKYSEKLSLLERMRLSTTVSNITRSQDTKEWQVEIQPSGEVLICDKLLVTTGLASKPNWPSIPTVDFVGPVMHSKDVGKRHSELTSEKIARVSIYGGCKSAVDAVLLCSRAGKKVDWIIRETGNGPGMMVQVRKRGRHAGIFMGRWKSFITPSVFSTAGFWYDFLHSGKNRFGSWLRKQMWDKMGTAPFKMETAAVNTLHGDEDFLKKLHEGKDIQVHRASIVSVLGSNLTLSDGTTIPCDAVVFATGWAYSTSIFEPSLAAALGLPAPSDHQEPSKAAYWDGLSKRAEKDLLSTYPVLETAPEYHQKKLVETPFRLYRHIIPYNLAAQHDRSLILLGMLSNLQYAMYSEVAALWGVSWMEGLLDESKIPSSKEEMDYEIVKFSTWSARRYLSRGRTRMVAGGEIQEIIDLLMRDMGLEPHRGKGSLRDTFLPYRAQDYKGIVQDMLAKSRAKVSG